MMHLVVRDANTGRRLRREREYTVEGNVVTLIFPLWRRLLAFLGFAQTWLVEVSYEPLKADALRKAFIDGYTMRGQADPKSPNGCAWRSAEEAWANSDTEETCYE